MDSDDVSWIAPVAEFLVITQPVTLFRFGGVVVPRLKNKDTDTWRKEVTNLGGQCGWARPSDEVERIQAVVMLLQNRLIDSETAMNYFDRVLNT